jgi:hypothetical protein
MWASVAPTMNITSLAWTCSAARVMNSATERLTVTETRTPVGSSPRSGHANLSTTMRYMHLAEGQKERAIRSLHRRPTAFNPAAPVEAGVEAV